MKAVGSEGEAEGRIFSFALPEFLLLCVHVNDVSAHVVTMARKSGRLELFKENGRR